MKGDNHNFLYFFQALDYEGTKFNVLFKEVIKEYAKQIKKNPNDIFRLIITCPKCKHEFNIDAKRETLKSVILKIDGYRLERAIKVYNKKTRREDVHESPKV